MKDSTRRTLERTLAYVAAPVIVAAAVAVRHALIGPVQQPETNLLLVAVALSAFLGGTGPGLVAVGIASLQEIYWQMEPGGSFAVEDPRDRVETIAFLGAGILVSVLIGRLLDYRRREAAALAEARATNEALRQSALRLALVLEGSQLGAWDWVVGEPTTTVNRRWREITGLHAEEGETSCSNELWKRSIHPDDAKVAIEAARAIVEGRVEGYDHEYRLPAGDGTWRWVRSRARAVVRNADGTAQRVSGTLVDINDRKVAAEKLRSSEEQYRTLVENLHAGVVVHASDTSIVLNNSTASELLGLTPEQMRGRVAIDPAWRFVRGDGSPMPTEEYPVSRVIATRRPVMNLTLGVDRPGSRDRTWLLVNAYPTFRSPGVLHQVVVTFVDVTGERKAEEERARLQAKLASASRLAAMGTLVAGVAHEINNPLTVITANAGALREDVLGLRAAIRSGGNLDPDRVLEGSEEGLELLDDVGTCADRIARIVTDLTVLGRPEQKRERIRLGDMVRSTRDWLPASVAHRAAIRTEVAEVADVMASASQIEQVLVNLVTNAALSFPDGRQGTITVRVRPGAPCRVRIEVSDDGPGIRPELTERIFEPFFTTRPHGKGTGLGLSICNAIVGAHGGTLTVESEMGRGSTFRIELPAAPTRDAAA